MPSADTAALAPERVMIHSGGPAETLVRAMPAGDPAGLRRLRALAPAYRLSALRARRPRRIAGRRLRRRGRTDPWRSGPRLRDQRLLRDPRLARAPGVPAPGFPEPRARRGHRSCRWRPADDHNYYHFLLDLLPRWGSSRGDARRADRRGLPAARGLTSASCWSWRALRPARGRGRQARATWRRSGCSSPRRPNQDLMAPPWIVALLRDASARGRPTGGHGRGALRHPRATTRNTRRYVEEPAVAGSRGARLHPPRPRHRCRCSSRSTLRRRPR